MEKGLFVKEFTQAQQQVAGFFVVASAKLSTASNGKAYWSLELQDATGKVDAKIWDPLSSTIADLPGNTVLWVKGTTNQFNNRLQLRVDDVRILDDEERSATDIRWFVPASSRPVDDMEAELHALCAREFTHEPWRTLARDILTDSEISLALRIFPAAKSMHHAWAGGLLEHTLGVCKLCLAMCDCYPELDRQTLLAGALCHDLGKIREFSAGLTTDYTDDGRLMGHIFQGLAMLAPLLERSGLEDGLKQHLTHLILSHHGTREFGAVQEPQTAEAIALHHADNVDAKQAMCREYLANADEQGNWTDYHRGMGHAIFRPMRTPKAPAAHEALEVAGAPKTAERPAELGVEEVVVAPIPQLAPAQMPAAEQAPQPEPVPESVSEPAPEVAAPVVSEPEVPEPTPEPAQEPAPQPKKRKKVESEQCLSLLKV